MNITRRVDGWCGSTDASAPVTRESPAIKRHLGEKDLTPGDPQSQGGAEMASQSGEPGPKALACSTNSCSTSGSYKPSCSKPCLGMCVLHHSSFLRPGGSLCSDVKLVAGTVKAQPRKCTGKLPKVREGAPSRQPHTQTPMRSKRLRSCDFFLFGQFGEIF